MADVSKTILIGFRIRFVTYVFIVNCAVYAYDWLLCVSDEVEMVSRSRLSWPIATYFVSRFSQMGYLCFGAVFLLSPGSNCDNILKMLGVCATVSVASTSFLFFLRVRAVYLQSIYATTTFGAFWLVVTCLNIYVETSLYGAHRSQYGFSGCSMPDLTAVSLRTMSTLVNDTLVFLAITYRLAADAMPTKGSRRFRLFSVMKGKGLYSLSRSLLQGGQLYYFSTILFFLLNLAIICSPPAPSGTEYVIALVYIAFTNMMACRVFRGVALGRMHVEPPGLTSTRIAAAFQ